LTHNPGYNSRVIKEGGFTARSKKSKKPKKEGEKGAKAANKKVEVTGNVP
jgi:hypothetical protein